MTATAAARTMATEVEPAINQLPTPTPRPQPFSPLRGEKRAMSDDDKAPSPVSDGPGTRAAGGGWGRGNTHWVAVGGQGRRCSEHRSCYLGTIGSTSRDGCS